MIAMLIFFAIASFAIFHLGLCIFCYQSRMKDSTAASLN